MYLYDSLPSGAHRGTVISLGKLGRATKRAPVQDSTKAPYRWIFARDLFSLTFVIAQRLIRCRVC